VAASAEGTGIRLSAPPPRQGSGLGEDTTTVLPREATTVMPRPVVAPPASAGTLGVPGAAALDERGNLPGGLLAVVAAALVAAGVFLPWFAVAGEDVSGWSASADAKVLVGVAAAITLAAALLIGGARSLVLRVALVVAGLAAAGLGAYEIASVGGLDDRFAAELGVGLFPVIGGGLVAVAAGLATRHRRRR
jgi:hypothetical protein